MEIVLDAGEFLAEQAHVVVVHQGDGAHHLGVRRFPRLFDQFLADQVAKGFGAVGVPAPPDQLIELLQQSPIDGDANPAQHAHASIIVSSAYAPILGGAGFSLPIRAKARTLLPPLLTPRLRVKYTVFFLLGYLLDSGSPRSIERCGAGALARGRPPGRPASRRTRRPPRSRGTAPPSRCQSDYLSQADTPNRENAVWRGFVGQVRRPGKRDGCAGNKRNAASGEPPCETLYPNLQ